MRRLVIATFLMIAAMMGNAKLDHKEPNCKRFSKEDLKKLESHDSIICRRLRGKNI